MGKAKKLRSISHKKRAPPTGGPSTAELEELQAMDFSVMAADEAQLFKGLVDLQGAVREATCVAIATMFGDAESDEAEAASRRKLQRMVDAGLLKKLIPRVVDPLPMVRQHALGALRNMSVTGGLELCEVMTAQNVVTPLVKVITDNATDKALNGGGDLRAVQLLEQAVALLGNLCESCQAAINELTQGELLPPIFKIAAQARTHSSLHLETLKLLLMITEGNAQLNEIIGANAAYQQTIGALILAPGDQLALQGRLEAVGVAMNLQAIMQVEDNVTRMVPVLEAALAYDAVNVVQMAQQASDHLELSQKSLLEDENVDDDTLTPEEEQKISAAQLKVRTWRDSVHTLTLALELTAQMAATEDENDDEEEWASDDEDAMEEYAASHMDTEAAIGANGSPVSRALETSRIFPLCVAILQGLVSIPQLSTKSIANDFEKMRIRACNAVNNLLLSVSWEVLSEEVVPQVFRNLCALYGNLNREAEAASATPTDFTLESSASNDLEVAVTAAMWSALRRSAAEDRQLAVSADDAQLILTCAAQGRAAESRLNAIGMIGSVGKRCSSLAEKEAVGRALVARLDDSSLEVVSETLNAVFDVYDDEEFDDTFRALNFLSALERTSSAMKAKLKAEQKQLDRALVAHVKETRLNLLRFIKYKKKHL
ncbi:HEAT repeat-containing protein 3 [Phytophthora ramorum]|uniref:HEAT repeat-containing protein 3 n=1 Tax=Phytophthora ramorum TaxID=164328 RepID=UPI0030A2CCD3|nr:HEAT repeat-containing protein 3 [Phytophthora ramorum]